MLESLDRDFRVSMINMFKKLVEKKDSTHEQIKNCSRNGNYTIVK